MPAEYFVDGMDPEVERAVRAAIAALEKLGARTEPVSLPHTEYGLAAYYLIAPAEASSNLARYDGVKYGLRAPGARDLIDMYSKTRAAGFGAEVKRRIMLGTYALSAGYYDAYYGQAQKVRTLVRRDFEQAFARVDVIVAPTTPGVAFKHGREGRPAADVPERRLHDPGQPRGPARHLGPGRLHRRPACRSGCSSSAAPSTRRRCCARPTPTSRRPPGTPRKPGADVSDDRRGLRDRHRARGARAARDARPRCSAAAATTFGAAPNTQTCPVCLGMPGLAAR